MGDQVQTGAARSRLAWPDVVKGICILWIVFFHCFGTYIEDRLPSPTGPAYFRTYWDLCAPETTAAAVGCAIAAGLVAVIRLGFHAVGVFLVLSGFGLTYALAAAPQSGWRRWYARRALRLFPMYWVAHLLYLVSPFVARPEPIDLRFLLSFLGDRVYPVYSLFYYANPAWWYFGLLLQLYLIFPLLFRLLQRVTALPFLVLCGAFTLTVRYVLLTVIPAHGYYVQGAFFGSRLWEFALGMALGHVWSTAPGRWDRRLFALPALAAGISIYTFGLYTYDTMAGYVWTDALIGTGLFVILAHLTRWLSAVPRLAAGLTQVGMYSYGLYLIHQPYVTYFGERMRTLSMASFIPAACALVLALAVFTRPLERWVNRAAARLATRPGRRERAPSPAMIGR